MLTIGLCETYIGDDAPGSGDNILPEGRARIWRTSAGVTCILANVRSSYYKSELVPCNNRSPRS